MRGIGVAVLGALAVGAVVEGRAADLSFSEGFVVLSAAGEAVQFFDTDTSTLNPDFTNTVAYVGSGEPLLLGGEVKANRTVISGSEIFAGNVALQYTIDGGPTNTVPLPRISTGPDTFQAATVTGMVEIATGLSSGAHTIDVWFTGEVLNHPFAPGQLMRLPGSGTYRASVYVIPRAPGLVALDDASHPAYARGMTNGANGGFGFGPWTNAILIDNNGDAAGVFVATNPPNTDLNHIATRGRAWGLFANEGSSGGNDTQISALFRPLPAPLSIGQTLSLDLEHGGIQSGSLSANNPPRVGGFVGFSLRPFGPTLAGDPDPIDPFGGLRNSEVMFGFRGGDAEYVIMDIQQTSGRPTGLPYSTNGVRVNVTRTASNLLTFVATSKGPGSARVTFTAEVGAGSLAWLAVYNRNAEQNDVFLNNLLLEDAPATNLVAYDDAADGAYAGGWTNGSNGGFGLGAWSLFSTNGNGGAAGHFLATNPPNTDLNFIASGGRAWGAYANDAGNPAGVQVASAFRNLPGSLLQKDQTLGFSLENGGISPINGEARVQLYGTPTFSNPQGLEFAWFFPGGQTFYTLADGRPQLQSTQIPFSSDGLSFEFTLLNDVEPFVYALRVQTFGAIAGTRYYYSYLRSAPKSIQFRVTDLEQSDAYFNRLFVRGTFDDGDGIPTDWELANGLDPNVNDGGDDDDLDGLLNVEEYIADTNPQSTGSFFRASALAIGSAAGVSFSSATGRLYTLEQTTNLLEGAWTSVPGQSNVPGTGADLTLTNSPADSAVFRLKVMKP